MKLTFGLVGYPLTHSFSQQYFNEKFEKEKIKAHYKMFSISSIDEMENILIQKNICGLNVTIPYKQKILKFLDFTQNIPQSLQACNCIKIINGKSYGYNTDVIGFEKSFIPLVKPNQTQALVLGNGGAAQAVKYVLQKNNIPFKIVNRTKQNNVDFIYDEINDAIIEAHKIIINTTPLGMYPLCNDCPSIPYKAITQHHFLYDLVYNPAQTLFLKNGSLKGATIKNGFEMLTIQAEESWRIWNE